METKVCSKCNIKKDVTEFYSYGGRCKLCIREYHKKYQRDYVKKNEEKVKEYRKVYKKNYYNNNKEKYLLYNEKNKERISLYQKEYSDNNKEKRNLRLKQRRITEPLYKLTCNIKSVIRQSLKNNGFTKNSRTFEILGCSYQEFREHIESQFEDWMSWDNYGIYNGKEKCGWEYDHIVPLSSAECEEDIIRLNHHSNIQPLCSYVNRNVKRDNIDWES